MLPLLLLLIIGYVSNVGQGGVGDLLCLRFDFSCKKYTTDTAPVPRQPSSSYPPYVYLPLSLQILTHAKVDNSIVQELRKLDASSSPPPRPPPYYMYICTYVSLKYKRICKYITSLVGCCCSFPLPTPPSPLNPDF